ARSWQRTPTGVLLRPSGGIRAEECDLDLRCGVPGCKESGRDRGCHLSILVTGHNSVTLPIVAGGDTSDSSREVANRPRHVRLSRLYKIAHPCRSRDTPVLRAWDHTTLSARAFYAPG